MSGGLSAEERQKKSLIVLVGDNETMILAPFAAKKQKNRVNKQSQNEPQSTLQELLIQEHFKSTNPDIRQHGSFKKLIASNRKQRQSRCRLSAHDGQNMWRIGFGGDRGVILPWPS